MFVPVEQLAGKTIGQYTLTKLIGRSELSVVYEAASSAQASPVMLTVIHLPDECVGEAWELFMERFEDEAFRLRTLQHPYVVPYYEFGEEFGYPYLITPLTASRTLVDLLQRDGITPAQMLQLLKQIAPGLDYVHSLGIVHGSLKPSSILLRSEQNRPRVMIANVGLAQILEMRGIGEVSHPLPHLFSVAGTLLTNPAYLAPEVVQGSPSDARSDMYALGILIYEMLCGRPPFVGSDPLEVALQHVNQSIPPMRSLRPELPPALDGALRSVLERDPARRLQQAERLVAVLEQTIPPLQEAGQGNFAPLRLGATGGIQKGMLVEKQWQGMPGVTGDKMPSLAPEFAAAAGGGTTRKSWHGLFRLPSSDALPPLPSASPLSPLSPLSPTTAQNGGRVFKPPLTLGSGVRKPIPPAAPSDDHAQQPLVTVIASGEQAKRMSLPSQQNASPFAASTANNDYTTQMAAGQQYSPLQASPAQMPPANYAGWAQGGNEMGMSADQGYAQQYNDPQAGVMSANQGYAQQYNDPQAGMMYSDQGYAQQQYMDGYGQGEWVQDEYGQPVWVSYEQDLGPAPNSGRRRALAIMGGAVIAAVLGAGGINLLRTMREDNNAPQGTTQPQASPPSATGQKPAGQPTAAPANQKAGAVIGNQKNLATNAAQDFTNPLNNHASILVHLPDGKFAAYDKSCTHQGVAVAYDPQTNKLVCPLHHSIFDPADNGKVVHGPAFIRLPAVKIQVNGDGTITVQQ